LLKINIYIPSIRILLKVMLFFSPVSDPVLFSLPHLTNTLGGAKADYTPKHHLITT